MESQTNDGEMNQNGNHGETEQSENEEIHHISTESGLWYTRRS